MPSAGSAPTSGTRSATASARSSRRASVSRRRNNMADPATLFDKIWGAHAIVVRPDGATLLHIDRHLVHDGSNNAFRFLQEKNLKVRRPDRTFATPDHYVSTLGRGLTAINDPNRRSMVEGLKAHAQETGVTLFDLGDKRQGIVHVVGPEQGLSQPGMVIVC